MSLLEILFASLAVLALAVIVGWRLLARRLSLPCPASLIWMLESRVMERAAGAHILIDRAGIERGMSVLDAGCGPGRVAIPVAQRVGQEGEVVAVDVQTSMLDRLAERIREEGLSNITPLRARLGEGALGEGRFHRALMVTVLGEIPDREAALREVYRSLKPGGLLSVTEVLPDPHYQTRRTVQALGEKAGFAIDRVYSGVRSFTMNMVKGGG